MMQDLRQLLHCKYHPTIKTYTYTIEYVQTIPSRQSFSDPRHCAQVALQHAVHDYGIDRIVNIHVLLENKVIESWKN